MDKLPAINSAPQKLKDENRIYSAKNEKRMTTKELLKSIRGKIQRTLRKKAESKSELL